MLPPFISGILQFLSFPPLSWWPLSFIALAPLFVFLERESNWKRIALGVFVYRLTSVFLIGYYIVEPLLWGSSVLIFETFAAIIIALKRMGVSGVRFYAAAAVAFMGCEYLEQYYSLMPVFVSGHPLANSPLIGAARWGGAYALTALALLANMSLAWVWVHGGRFKRSAALIAAFGIMAVISGDTPAPPAEEPSSSGTRVLAISVADTFDVGADELDDAALAQTREGDVRIRAFIRDKLAPIRAEANATRPDLIVFPEDMINIDLIGIEDGNASHELDIASGGTLLDEYAKFAQSADADVMATMTVFDAAGAKTASTILIGKDGSFRSVYDKRHLTIGSEWWPFGTFIPFYWEWSLDALPKATREETFIGYSETGQYSRGASYQPAQTLSNGVRIMPLVCLERVYPSFYSAAAKNGAAFVVISSSNAWLSYGREAFLESVVNVSRVGAVSNGLPVILSGKGEPPAVIMPDGVIRHGKIHGNGWDGLLVTLDF